jgi:hypothetical protein
VWLLHGVYNTMTTITIDIYEIESINKETKVEVTNQGSGYSFHSKGQRRFDRVYPNNNGKSLYSFVM